MQSLNMPNAANDPLIIFKKFTNYKLRGKKARVPAQCHGQGCHN